MIEFWRGRVGIESRALDLGDHSIGAILDVAEQPLDFGFPVLAVVRIVGALAVTPSRGLGVDHFVHYGPALFNARRYFFRRQQPVVEEVAIHVVCQQHLVFVSLCQILMEELRIAL